MLDGAISTKFLTHRVSLQSSHPNFQKKNCLTQNGGHFEFFAKNAKLKNAYILKTVLDRADYADFGCHNSIRLEAEHFLNPLALIVISFSGCFIFFASDPVIFYPTAPKGCRGIVFTHGVRMGGRWEKVCPGFISETVRYRKLILGRDIG